MVSCDSVTICMGNVKVPYGTSSTEVPRSLFERHFQSALFVSLLLGHSLYIDEYLSLVIGKERWEENSNVCIHGIR